MMRLFVFVSTSIAAAMVVVACSSSDSGSGNPAPGDDSGASSGSTSSSSSSSSTSSSSSSSSGGTDSGGTDSGGDGGMTGGGGINVKDRGMTYALTEMGGATAGSGGYGFKASTSANPARQFGFFIRRGVRPNAGSTVEPGDIVPGTYTCGAADATVDTPQLLVVNMQWAVADQGSVLGMNVWQTDLGAPCTVTLTTFDAAGGRAKGTFSGTLGPASTNATGQKTSIDVTGDFDLVRTN